MGTTLAVFRFSRLYTAAAAEVAIEAACVAAIAPEAADMPVAAPAIVNADPRRLLRC